MAKKCKGVSQRFRECWSGDVLEFQVELVLPSLWTPEIPESDPHGYRDRLCQDSPSGSPFVRREVNGKMSEA